MSQYTAKIRKITLMASASAALFIGASASASVGSSVQNPGLRNAPGVVKTDTVPLSLAGQSLDVATLDWRTPEQTFTVELAPSDWIEDVALTLYGDPVGTAPAGRDVEVSLNGGDPVRLQLQRQGFTARINLPLKDIRTGRNTVALRLLPARGVSCLTENDGGWEFNLKRSRLDTVVEAKSRSVLLSEVNTMFSRPSAAPRRIALRAVGDDKLALEALMAQGVALRTDEVPRFTLGGAGEIEVIAGTRLALAGIVTDESILESKGARVAVHEGRPVRLILTGDDEAQVREAVDAFATFELPDARRRIATPVSLRFAGALSDQRDSLTRRTKISELGGLDFSENWGAGPDEVIFDVADPQGSKARVKLDLERAAFIAPESTVNVELNGRSLGQATLSDTRMKLDYVVPQGWLKGQGNSLRLTPDLHPVSDGCAPAIEASGLMVRPKSRIELSVAAKSAQSDLSRLSAGGSLLTAEKGEGTHVVLPTAKSAREDALRILGRVAKADGEGLTAASYGTQAQADLDLLVLGGLPKAIDAPRNVDAALGTSSRGSVVSLFPEGERWVGVFAPMRAGSLGATANALSGEAWHDLNGGISRIDGGRVEMAHMAFDGPARDLGLVPAMPALPSLEEFGPEVTKQVEVSAEKLNSGWSQIGIKTPDLAQFNPLRAKVKLRGTYDAPKAVSVDPRFTLASIQEGEHAAFAGFNLERFVAKSERQAARIRKQIGVKEYKPKPTWSWGDQHLSFSAMLVFLAFGWACFFLSTAEWKNR
jgi:hypothetical protein